MDRYSLSAQALAGKNLTVRPRRPSRAPIQGSGAPVGRNDLCPCGSKKKFKRCCRLKR